MKYLEKTWVRAIISFFIGAVIPEWIFVSLREANTPGDNSKGLIYIALVSLTFFWLSSVVKKNRQSF